MRIFILSIALFLVASCSTKSIIIQQEDTYFNSPFIDAAETSQLDFGLTKDDDFFTQFGSSDE